MSEMFCEGCSLFSFAWVEGFHGYCVIKKCGANRRDICDCPEERKKESNGMRLSPCKKCGLHAVLLRDVFGYWRAVCCHRACVPDSPAGSHKSKLDAAEEWNKRNG